MNLSEDLNIQCYDCSDDMNYKHNVYCDRNDLKNFVEKQILKTSYPFQDGL